LESLILGCSILIPISSAQICGSFFWTLCTHPRSYLKKQSKTGNLSCQCLRLWKGEQVTLGSPQHLICKTKAHPLDQGSDMLEFINFLFLVCCAFSQPLLKFNWPRKLVAYLSTEENVFTSLEKMENAERRIDIHAKRWQIGCRLQVQIPVCKWAFFNCNALRMHHCIPLVSQAW
jgi:hypothetical protein